MKLGILADIHEQVEPLRWAIHVLREHGAEHFVLLGDILEMGKHIDETVQLLEEVQAVGVWGNHDAGFCLEPSERIRQRYTTQVCAFMAKLQPRLQIDGCLFTHVEPWLDPSRIEDLWYFDGPPDTPERLARSFAAVPNRVLFLGHFHRWLLGTPEGLLPWQGDRPVILDCERRHLVVIHAVWDGKCALFDTRTDQLLPFSAGQAPAAC
jgi:hypothetical protein